MTRRGFGDTVAVDAADNHRSRASLGAACWQNPARYRDPRFGPFQSIISANAFVEIDHLAPIIPSVDVTNRSAFRAAKVSADVTPVPIREVFQRVGKAMRT
jgi:hypothetical protein